MMTKKTTLCLFIILTMTALLGCSQDEEPQPEQALTQDQALRVVPTTRSNSCEGSSALFCRDHWKIAYSTGLGQPLTSVWGRSGKVTVVGWQTPDNPYSSMIIAYNGEEWIEDQSGPHASLRDVNGQPAPETLNGVSDDPEVILVGTDTTYVVKSDDEAAWAQTSPSSIKTDLNAVWPISDKRTLVVGDGGAAYLVRSLGNSNNQHWRPLSSTTQGDLNGIWGTNGTSIPNTRRAKALIVGDSGAIFEVRWGFRRMVEVDSGTEQDLNGIWGTNGTSTVAWNRRTRRDQGQGIWGTNGTSAVAVGNGGTILALRPDGWDTLDSGSHADLNAIWGTNGTSIIVGESGTILVTTDGVNWTKGPALTQANLTDIWGESLDKVFVTSDSGQLFEFNLIKSTEGGGSQGGID